LSQLLSKLFVASCSFTSTIKSVRLDALLKCVVIEVVLLSNLILEMISRP